MPAVIDSALYRAVFVETWPFWAGGAAIGLLVLVLLLGSNKMLGVSTGFRDACSVWTDPSVRRSWRFPFLAGIIGGGAVAALLAGSLDPRWTMGSFDLWVSGELWVKALVFTAGGVLLGFGARLAGGCTSGHGIVGMAQVAPSSIVATAAFLVAGGVVANVLLRSLGA